MADETNLDDGVNWRVDIRFSMNKDAGVKARQKVTGYLKKCNFTNTGNTGTWSTISSEPLCVAKQLSKSLKLVASPKTVVPNVEEGTDLDHMWIYIEKIN